MSKFVGWLPLLFLFHASVAELSEETAQHDSQRRLDTTVNGEVKSMWELSEAELKNRTCACLVKSAEPPCTCKEDIHHPYDIFFLEVCGSNASFFKESHYINFYELPLEYLRIALPCMLFGIVPYVFVLMVTAPLKCPTCKPVFKYLRMPLDAANLCLSAVCTYYCILNFHAVYHEMTIGMGDVDWYCSFFLVMDYAAYENNVKLLSLMSFSATDTFAQSCKVLHDLLFFCGAEFFNLGMRCKMFFCCIWCKFATGGCLGKFCLMYLCFFPALVCMYAVGFGLIIFLAVSLNLVFFVYLLVMASVSFVFTLPTYAVAMALSSCGIAETPSLSASCIALGDSMTMSPERDKLADGEETPSFYEQTHRHLTRLWSNMGYGTKTVIIMALLLKVSMIEFVCSYGMVVTEPEDTEDMLVKAGLYGMFDWHWLWYWWCIYWHMFGGVKEFLIDAFLFPLKAPSSPYIAALQDPIGSLDNIWAKPGAGFADLQNFTKGILACRLITGVLMALSAWCDDPPPPLPPQEGLLPEESPPAASASASASQYQPQPAGNQASDAEANQPAGNQPAGNQPAGNQTQYAPLDQTASDANA